MRKTRPISPTVYRRSSHFAPKHLSVPAQNPESGDGGLLPVLHSLPLHKTRGTYLQFESFDAAYLDRLRAGDFRTQEHFCAYFTKLIRIKLYSRLKSSPDAIEDLRQETFSRFFVALRDGKISQPDRLGSFMNSMCNNVLFEYFRMFGRSTSLDDDGEEKKEISSHDPDPMDVLAAKEMEKKVRNILEDLSERDRRLLREVFLEERDKDEVCRDFGVDREYLRVLLHRAKQAFKSAYRKNMGDNPPDFATA